MTKKDSLAKIVESVIPDVIALCETKKACPIKKDELSEYEIAEKDFKQGQEGFIVGVREGTCITVKEITDTELNNIVTVKVVYPNMNLRIIVVHAPQETDRLETRMEFFEELSVQIERAITSADELIVVGDMNARITLEGSEIVSQNGSQNGKELCDLIHKYNLKVGNFHESCVGKWTRIQPRRDGTVKRSQLDYILSSEKMYQSLQSITVDEEKIFCPYREIKENGARKIVYSDHCAIIADLKIDIGRVQKTTEKVSGWNFNEDGYERYSIESEASLDFDLSSPCTTNIYSSWVVAFEKLLAKCFRRQTINKGGFRKKSRSKYSRIRDIISSMSKKGKIQRNIAKLYLQKLVEVESCRITKARAERLKKTTESLTSKERFSPAGYWKVKKAAKKGTRKEQGPSSIIKDNGVEVHGAKAIAEAYLEEFEKRLENRKPAEGWEQYTDETNTVIRNWLEGESAPQPPFTNEEIDAVLCTLKDGAPGVDMYPPKLFKNAGVGVVRSLLLLCNKMKESKEIPEQWDLVKIVTIYKQKGSKKNLKCYRGIFLAIIISKIFEKLIKNRIDNKLERTCILQAGSRKKRGPPDNVFLFRGVMDHYKFTKKTLYVTAYDFEQAFDSMWLEDSILSLKEIGVEKEYLQLIYNLNRRASVSVQTPSGPTPVFKTDPIVKQGTVLGPNLCSSSTAEYCGQNIGACVGNAIISSLLYVDDIIDLSCSKEDYLAAHLNALLFTKRKKLTLSGTKCYTMILNKQTKDGKIPILIIDDKKNVILATEITYLGDVFNSSGNNNDLIADRIKRGTKSMIMIASLMAETEVGVHHVSVMLLLYRALFLSTMLFNSQTWSNLRKKDITELRTLQLKFLKRTIGVASSTSNAFTFLELGVLPIEFEIEKRQLMYLHRILQLESTDPVSKMFWEMKRLNDAGEKNWWSGVEPCLQKYNLPELSEIKEMSKDLFSQKVKTAVVETAFAQLVAECRNLKKTANLVYGSFKLQDYLSNMYPSQARIVFKWRSETLDIKTHLTYKYKDVQCRCCKEQTENPRHIINCGMVSNIDSDLDILEMDNMDDRKRSDLKLMVSRICSFLERVKYEKG